MKSTIIGLSVKPLPKDKMEYGGSYDESYCIIYIKDIKSGYTMQLDKFSCIMGCGSLMPSQNTLQWEEGYEGPGKINSIISSPDEKNFLFFYYHPYYPNTPGYIVIKIINRIDMSKFNNGIGLKHYKKKDYKTALKYFMRSLEYNKDYPRGIFNTACMYGIMKDADKSVEYLKKLKSINSKQSKRYLKMIKKERDLNPVRSHPRFREFIKGL
jgi:tetratricopeptide (TPR) repeat protein